MPSCSRRSKSGNRLSARSASGTRIWFWRRVPTTIIPITDTRASCFRIARTWSPSPALRKNPVFMYFQDGFQKPAPFTPDIAVGIDDVIEKKLGALDAHVSQFYEWMPWLDGILEQVPKEAGARKEWLRKQYMDSRETTPAVRQALVKWYGQETAKGMKYAEAFEICEYGKRPSEAELRQLFTFFPANPR